MTLYFVGAIIVLCILIVLMGRDLKEYDRKIDRDDITALIIGTFLWPASVVFLIMFAFSFMFTGDLDG